jgi:hypothetical protein
MASASKRRSIRPAVRRKVRPAAAPLDALRDPIRKQEVDSKRGNKSTRARGNGFTPLFTGREFIELMNRRARRFWAGLPGEARVRGPDRRGKWLLTPLFRRTLPLPEEAGPGASISICWARPTDAHPVPCNLSGPGAKGQ